MKLASWFYEFIIVKKMKKNYKIINFIVFVFFNYLYAKSNDLFSEKIKFEPKYNINISSNFLLNKSIDQKSTYINRKIFIKYYYMDYNETEKSSTYSNIKRESSFIMKQFVVSELCGLGLGLFGAVIGGQIAPKNAGLGSFSYGFTGMYCGYTIGSSLGTYLSGNNSKYCGSYFSTIAGAIIGAYVGIKLFNTFDQKGFGSISLIISPPIGSIIGFNIFRKTKN